MWQRSEKKQNILLSKKGEYVSSRVAPNDCAVTRNYIHSIHIHIVHNNEHVVSKSVFYVNTCMCVVQITNEYYDKRTFIQWFIKFVQQMKSSLTNRKCYNSQWCVDLCAFKILIEIYIYILSVPIPIPSGVFAYEFEKPMLCVICKHINSNLQ